MKVYVEVVCEIEVDDKFLPLLTNTDSNCDQLHQEFCTEVKNQMGIPYSADASAEDKKVITTVYDNCWEPLIEN